ncbi:MAG TPA: LmeA family phospholipid-binding protein [Abditibacteriaceae bacterium]
MNPLIAVFAGGLLLFNSAASPRKVEGKFEDELRKAFPTAKVDVSVKGKRGLNVVNGKFREIRISMRDFQLAPTPVALTPPAPIATQSTVEIDRTSLAPVEPVAATPPAVTPLFSVASVAKVRDRGRVANTYISLANFGYGAFQVESLDAEFRDVDYDWAELKKGRALNIEKAGAASVRLTIPASSFGEVLRSRLTTIQNVKLSLQGGRVRIEGTRPAPLVGTPIPVVFSAKPEARGREIWMNDVSLSLGGAPVPAAISRTILGDFNPVYTFDREGTWPFRLELKSADAQNERLTLAGDLNFLSKQ